MGDKGPIIDYQGNQVGGRPARSSALVGLAYALIALPIVGAMFLNGDAPTTTIEIPCMIAVAFGASLFVVRRRRDSGVGWVGLIVWGLLTLAWVVVPIVGRLVR